MLHPHAVRFALVVVVMLVARTVEAEDPPRPSTSLALPDVLQVAIRQSPTVTRAVIDIELARADMIAASGLRDFTLTAAAGFTRTRSWQTFGDSGIIVQDSAGGDVGLARGLPTGGTVSATVGGQHVTETFEPDAMPSPEPVSGIVTSASAKLVHPILRGFGERIARAPVRRAAITRDVATLQQTAEALKLTRDVLAAYWQVAYALQVVAIRKDSLRLATEQLAITNRAVRSGSVSPTETLSAEQAIALREQALLQAGVEVSRQSLALRRLAGLELGRDQIDVTPTTPPQAPTRSFDIDATIARALAQNPLLALLEARAKAADIDIEVTADATRPRLDLLASATSTGRATEISESIRQLGQLANPTFAIVLEYEQQIGAHAAMGAHERAKALRRRARVDLEDARREVTVAVAHAIDLLRAAQKRIVVSDRAIGLAKRTLEIEQARFLVGKATNFDVLLRQDDLQQASAARALALADALAAEATIDALTGDLLSRLRIRILPP